MPTSQEHDRLDELIDERQLGRARPLGIAGDELEELADLTVALRGLGARAPAIDEDAVSARVAAYTESTPQSPPPLWSRLRGATWRAVPSFAPPRVLALAALALLLLVGVVAGVLLQSPQSASASFIEDVRELQRLADSALADGELSSEELATLGEHADLLRAAIAGDSSALGDLRPDELREVADALVGVLGLLAAHGGETDGQLLEPLVALGLVSGSVNGALAEEAYEAAAGVCGDIASEHDLELCEDAIEVAEAACEDLSEAAEEACEDALDELEEAGEQQLALYSATQYSDLVAAAVAACSDITSAADFQLCQDEVEAAEAACELLSGAVEETCEEELDALEDAAEQQLALYNGTHYFGLIAVAVAACSEITSAADFQLCEDEVEAAEAACELLSGAVEEACEDALDELEEAGEQQLALYSATHYSDLVAAAVAVCSDITSAADFQRCEEGLEDAEAACELLSGAVEEACEDALEEAAERQRAGLATPSAEQYDEEDEEDDEEEDD